MARGKRQPSTRRPSIMAKRNGARGAKSRSGPSRKEGAAAPKTIAAMAAATASRSAIADCGHGLGLRLMHTWQTDWAGTGRPASSPEAQADLVRRLGICADTVLSVCGAGGVAANAVGDSPCLSAASRGAAIDVNGHLAHDATRRTLLHDLLSLRCYECARHLVQSYGADPLRRDAAGVMPLTKALTAVCYAHNARALDFAVWLVSRLVNEHGREALGAELDACVPLCEGREDGAKYCRTALLGCLWFSSYGQSEPLRKGSWIRRESGSESSDDDTDDDDDDDDDDRDIGDCDDESSGDSDPDEEGQGEDNDDDHGAITASTKTRHTRDNAGVDVCGPREGTAPGGRPGASGGGGSGDDDNAGYLCWCSLEGRRALSRCRADTRDPRGPASCPVWRRRYRRRLALCLQLLTECGCDIGRPMPWLDGNTALHVCVASQMTDQLRVLLACGADPNVRNASGLTPLVSALMAACELAVVRALLAAGADPGVPTGDGAAPLHICLMGRETPAVRFEKVRLLVEAGADVDCVAQWGATPLIMAALGDHEPVAHLLLSAGADTRAVWRRSDPDLADNAATAAAERNNAVRQDADAMRRIKILSDHDFCGKTAADVAQAVGNDRLAHFIRTYGAPRPTPSPPPNDVYCACCRLCRCGQGRGLIARVLPLGFGETATWVA